MRGRDAVGDRDVPTGSWRAPWQAVVLEITASLLALGAVVMIPLHHVAARLAFLGDQAVIHAEEVRFYWTLVGILALAVIASFAGALWRRGRKMFAGHTLVAVVGVAAALAFSVTATGSVAELDRDDPIEREQPDRRGGSGCHSGGDSDGCVGG